MDLRVGKKVGGWVIQGGIKLLVSPPARLLYRPHIEGRHHIPRTGAVIIASNHLSAIDSAVIPICAPRPVLFLAKAEYFEGSGFRGQVSRTWNTLIGSIPVQRGDHFAAQDSLDTALGALDRGQAFGIYPEGTRSRDGRLYRGRTGVAWLALESGAPVVPVGLIGTNDVQPIGTRYPRVKHVTVRFGSPIWFTPDPAKPSGLQRRAVTDKIMSAIHDLSGQELAGHYNEVTSED